MKKISVFAPATVANVGPGFDVLGFALENPGDIVEGKIIPEPGIKIKRITGARLPYEPEKNTVGISASDILKKLDVEEGVEITLHKNLPLGSGLGGSGASAVGGAYVVNLLFGEQLKKEQLIGACLKAEATVSGHHADNVAPSMMGGFVLIRSYDPLHIIPLGSVDMYVAIATPEFELSTKLARSAVPRKILLKDVISNTASLATIITAIHRNDVKLLGLGINDKVIEPARAHLIPGFYDVKKAALDSGSYGCSISGAGPSVFAVADEKERAKQIGKGMQEAFLKNDLKSKIHISKVSRSGARKIKVEMHTHEVL